MKQQPTCRYGHGDLEEIRRHPESHLWGFVGITLQASSCEDNVEAAVENTVASGRVFSVRLFRCGECGYIETFDDEVSHG